MFSEKCTEGRAIAVTAAALLLTTVATAAETDQFYARDEKITDATEVLNDKMNRKLARIVQRHRHNPDSYKIAYAAYREFGGLRFTDKFESWLIDSSDVDKRRVSRRKSIYADIPIWSTRAVYIFDLGQTLNISGNLVGSDKISHFFSQGWKFYKRYNKSGSEAAAARRGVLTERAIFGAGMTGSFSNADLVANYEGHLFYRSLFEDDVIPGKPAILRWDDGEWVVQRDFDWADHVNPYWDEALNMNSYDALLRNRMYDRLASLCPQYWENPALYEIEDEAQLREQYAHLGMRETRATRLDNLCLAHLPEAVQMLTAYNFPTANRNLFGL